MRWRQRFPVGRVVMSLLIAGDWRSALEFSPFVVCSDEESFEGSPSFLLNGQTFPGFAVVYKKAGLI